MPTPFKGGRHCALALHRARVLVLSLLHATQSCVAPEASTEPEKRPTQTGRPALGRQRRALRMRDRLGQHRNVQSCDQELMIWRRVIDRRDDGG